MASPQVENGYTRIANEILEALMKTRIPGRARQILDCVIRWSYGFGETYCDVCPGDFSKATGIRRQEIYREIQKLTQMNILGVRKKAYGSTIRYWIIKDYEKWEPYAKKRTYAKKRKSVRKKANTPIKEIKKDIVEIISYLNDHTGKNFKPSASKTKTVIPARLNEGYTVDDFKRLSG